MQWPPTTPTLVTCISIRAKIASFCSSELVIQDNIWWSNCFLFEPFCHESDPVRFVKRIFYLSVLCILSHVAMHKFYNSILALRFSCSIVGNKLSVIIYPVVILLLVVELSHQTFYQNDLMVPLETVINVIIALALSYNRPFSTKCDKLWWHLNDQQPPMWSTKLYIS